MKRDTDRYWDMPSSLTVAKFLNGFGKTIRNVMNQEEKLFEDELNDLEKGYRDLLDEATERFQEILPKFIQVLEEFVSEYKKIEIIRDKLDTLLYKKDIKGCCGGCGE